MKIDISVAYNLTSFLMFTSCFELSGFDLNLDADAVAGSPFDKYVKR